MKYICYRCKKERKSKSLPAGWWKFYDVTGEKRYGCKECFYKYADAVNYAMKYSFVHMVSVIPRVDGE